MEQHNCPTCGKLLDSNLEQTLEVKESEKLKWENIYVVCPNCNQRAYIHCTTIFK